LEHYYRAGTLSAAFISLAQSTGAQSENNKQAVDNIKPGATESALALGNPPPPQITPPSTPPVRIPAGIYTGDPANLALTNYVYPNGVSAGRDAARAKNVTDFMKQQNINAPLNIFLNSSLYANQRTALARQLGLIQ
jgi:hypothetical protein